MVKVVFLIGKNHFLIGRIFYQKLNEGYFLYLNKINIFINFFKLLYIYVIIV
jgi:hypothetical protein